MAGNMKKMKLSRDRLRQKPGKTLRKWLAACFFALIVVFMALGAFKTAMTLADSQPADTQSAPESNGPNEITGTLSEAIRKLQDLIKSDNQTFIYYYEPNCERCKKSESAIFASAEKKGLTVHLFNIKKYKKALDLKNEKGIRLVSFYKQLPVVGYYNKGWLIAWADGDQSEKIYDEFFDHFRFGE